MSLQTFAYARDALAEGQWWRIATASVVHVSAVHLAMNVAALVAVLAIWGAGRQRQGMTVLAVLALAQWPAAWWLAPDLAWGAGMSGALHGLVACWCVADASDGAAPRAWRRFGAAGLAGLGIKLGAEAAWPSVDATLPVAAELHWIGVALGATLGLGFALGRAWRARTTRGRRIRSGAAPSRPH